jgi:hypothetical protein
MQLALRAVATIYVVAVAVNYPWELAQAPLFTSASHQGSVFVHCLIASLGDGLMLALLYGVGTAVRGRADWFRRPAVCPAVLAAGRRPPRVWGNPRRRSRVPPPATFGTASARLGRLDECFTVRPELCGFNAVAV